MPYPGLRVRLSSPHRARCREQASRAFEHLFTAVLLYDLQLYRDILYEARAAPDTSDRQFDPMAAKQSPRLLPTPPTPRTPQPPRPNIGALRPREVTRAVLETTR